MDISRTRILHNKLAQRIQLRDSLWHLSDLNPIKRKPSVEAIRHIYKKAEVKKFKHLTPMKQKKSISTLPMIGEK